jgi:hypothetical protein
MGVDDYYTVSNGVDHCFPLSVSSCAIKGTHIHPGNGYVYGAIFIRCSIAQRDG